MKKLRLMLDELAVETFETAQPVDRSGTVVGQADSSAGPRLCDVMCSGGCYYTEYNCGSGPFGCAISREYSCVCQSFEWACPDTQECPEVTSFGEATTC